MPYASGPGLRAVELSSYPIKSEKTGIITGSVEFIRDITEQKQLEAQLRQTQKHEAIGNLAGGIAHDFNNILAGIFGFCQLVMNLGTNAFHAMKESGGRLTIQGRDIDILNTNSFILPPARRDREPGWGWPWSAVLWKGTEDT